MITIKRVILGTLGVATIVAFVLSQTAGSNRQYQLGGAWLGNNGAGNIWSAVHAPLDPEGRTMAGTVHFNVYNADIAAILSTLGADSLSSFVGQTEMLTRDTAKWSLLGHALKQGNPPTIQGILLSEGTFKYTSRDSLVLNYTFYVYLPSADANGDGFPDEGSTPLIAVPGVVDTAQRVMPPGDTP